MIIFVSGRIGDGKVFVGSVMKLSINFSQQNLKLLTLDSALIIGCSSYHFMQTEYRKWSKERYSPLLRGPSAFPQVYLRIYFTMLRAYKHGQDCLFSRAIRRLPSLFAGYSFPHAQHARPDYSHHILQLCAYLRPPIVSWATSKRQNGFSRQRSSNWVDDRCLRL